MRQENLAHFCYERLIIVSRYGYIQYQTRVKLQGLLRAGYSVKEAADLLGVQISTLYREIKRGIGAQGDYDAEVAQKAVEENIRHRGRKVPAPAGAGTAERKDA